MSENKGFSPLKLRTAREARGLTITELALRIGVSKQALSLYEQPEKGVTPRPEVLDRISEALNLPKLYFILPMEDIMQDLRWRSRASTTLDARKIETAKFKWLARIIIPYLERFVDIPQTDLPPFEYDGDILKMTGNEIEEVANAARKYFGLSNGVISNITQLLESRGVITYFSDLHSDSQDGYSIYLKDTLRAYVCLANGRSNARTRFSAAHELAHLVMHRNVPDQVYAHPASHKILEHAAHRFAGAFLFPANSFLNELHYPSLENFEELKRRWKVSMKMMIQRCSDLGVISERHERNLYITYSRRRYGICEPYDDEPVETPRLLRSIFELIQNSGVQEGEDMLFNITLKPDDIHDKIPLEKTFFEHRIEPPAANIRLHSPKVLATNSRR